MSGFGTLGYSHEGNDQVGFMRNITQPISQNGNGSFASDSDLGLQLSYTPTPQFEATIQAVARSKQDATLNNSLEWAFLGWHPNDAWDLRAGRMGLDIFLISDYRNLGFSQPWVRPPTEFYGWVPFFSINGADVAYNFRTGNTRWRVKTQFGNSSSDIALDADNSFKLKASNIVDLTVHAERGAWQFKAGFSTFTIGSQPGNFAQATNGLASVAAASPFAAIRNEADSLDAGFWLQGARVDYTSLGTAYDDGIWLLQGEWAHITSTSRMMPTGQAGYITAGRHFGSLTPYATWARFKPDQGAVTPQNDWSLLGANAVAVQTAAVAAYNNFRIDQRTASLGLRWDIGSRTDLKVQWDHSSIGARGYGLWQVNNLVNGSTPTHIDLLSVTMDFVF